MSTAVSASHRPPATAPTPARRIDDAATRASRDAERVSNSPAAACPTALGSSPSLTALAYPTPCSTTLAPVRRAVAIWLLTLGVLLLAVPTSTAQTVTPPTAPASTTSASTSTTARPAAAQSRDGLPTLGEGFPWITVGAVVLVAGLVGARLRRTSHR
jgi:hypothetical protein